MTALRAVVLGVVQGLTEFLPISSSAHLILVPVVLGWPDQGLAFDAAIHLGTALALLGYFGAELGKIARGLLAGDQADRRLALAVGLGSVPAGLAGLLLERAIQTDLRTATVVGLSQIGWALVLWWADRQASHGRRVHELRDVGVRRALLVGSAQAIALIPGTSRSGITLSAGLFAGLDRPTAARFAFLLGLPITAAAGLIKTAALLGSGAAPVEPGLLGLGLFASFAAGLAAVWFLVRYLRQRTLAVFVVYRVALGLLVLWLAAGLD